MRLRKLASVAELFDTSSPPFLQPLPSSGSKEASAARTKLQAALEQLNPVGGILDQGGNLEKHPTTAGYTKSPRTASARHPPVFMDPLSIVASKFHR